jgi:2-oxoglutarate dehydrogenase E2 component (dihydrolipoamide succinyltransferase)
MSDAENSDAATFAVVVPTIGESITSVFVSRWFKAVGGDITEGEPLLEIDSDKASLEVPAPVSGRVVQLMAGEGDEMDIGAVIAVIDTSVKPAASPAASPAPSPSPSGAMPPGGAAQGGGSSAATAPRSAPAQAVSAVKGPQSGPAARHAAAGSGVDIQGVHGTGVRGRVLSRDVAAAALATSQAVAGGGQAIPGVQTDKEGLIERVPMSPLRRTIARRLVEAQQQAAILTTFNEVDLTNIIGVRKRYQERFVKRYGRKLGFMSFFVKASIEALKEFPVVNASVDDDGTGRLAVLYKRYYNIGVAVSTDRGLMVPILRNADQLSFFEVETGIAELAERGREGRLTLSDFQDGTFTISNGGVFGSLMSTPILNPPQVGILGMHTIQQRPVAVDGKVEIRPMMYLALSYDHRIIDGRGAVGFLVRIKELVENPERILLEV